MMVANVEKSYAYKVNPQPGATSFIIAYLSLKKDSAHGVLHHGLFIIIIIIIIGKPMKAKHKVYMNGGNTFHVTCDGSDTVSTSDKFIRFFDKSGSITIERLLVAKDQVAAIESTPVMAANVRVNNFIAYDEIIEQTIANSKHDYSLRDNLSNLVETAISLDLGRQTGKTFAAKKLILKHGGLMVVRTCNDAKGLGVPAISGYNLKTKFEPDLPKSARKFLVVDEFFYYNVPSKLVYDYADAHGFKHVVFLGRTV